MNQVYNFNAGPSILPQEVYEQAQHAIHDFNHSGLSILEYGHRTPAFEAVVAEARLLLKELMHLDDNYEALFLHGGASTQFMQIPMNFLGKQDTAAMIDTGVWSSKAIKEAGFFGNVDVVASSKDAHYTYIPKSFTVQPQSKYIHITTNNTIYGTQWHDFSNINSLSIPLIADMSSDILSKEINFSDFDFIYAGAQKNIGAAGTTIVVMHKKLIEKINKPIPTMMDYEQHINNASMLNTPPVFAIYICLLTLRWLKKNGGVAAIEKINHQKATLLYNTLDSIPFIHTPVAKEDRSKMNAVFTFTDEKLEKEFLQISKENNFVGIQGHRSVGGFRVSLYNALPLSSVQYFTDIIKHFAQTKG